MDKDLPKVFKNKIEKPLTNNESYSYHRSDLEQEEKVNKKEEKLIEKNINQKIDDIFTSSRYVYKADVIIKTKLGEKAYKIIGKNANHLITIDNELIPIVDIEDIHFKDE